MCRFGTLYRWFPINVAFPDLGCNSQARFGVRLVIFSASELTINNSPVEIEDCDAAYGPTQEKLAASLASPEPEYFATIGNAQSGRVNAGLVVPFGPTS